MNHKIVIVAFAGEAPCFAHALLNGLDMQARGWEVKLVIEGRATALIKELAEPDAPFAPLFDRVKKPGLSTAFAGPAPIRWEPWPQPRHRACPWPTRCRGIRPWPAMWRQAIR